MDITLRDTLDTGLAFVSLDSIAATPGLSTSEGTFADVLAAAVISDVGSGDQNMGRRVEMDFGTVTNGNTDNGTNEVISITYTVVVLNNTGNVRGQQRNNNAQWIYDGGTSSDRAPNVRIVEPLIDVTKTVAPTTGDGGDTLTYTIDVFHQCVQNNADAYDLNLADTIPANVTYVPGSLQNTAGVAPTTLTESAASSAARGMISPSAPAARSHFKALSTRPSIRAQRLPTRPISTGAASPAT